MSEFESHYVAKKPDSEGRLHFTEREHQVWQTLYERQMELVQGRACQAYLDGIEQLALSADKIPQLIDVTQRLQAATGWSVEPVEALISASDFFHLLARRCFPAATFIRTPEDIDYVKEPDIFHEIFGHCPMLTNPIFADFCQGYAKMVLTMSEQHWPLLQRLFWFTVEFGLMIENDELKIYGGGILSSFDETVYAVESDIPQRRLFNPLDAFRTPYRIDQLQTVYFVIRRYEQLFDFVQSDVMAVLNRAYELGEFPPTFEVDLDNPSVHIACC